MKRIARIQTVITPVHRKKLDNLTQRYGTMNEVIERGIELLEQMESEATITESDEEILELKRRSDIFDSLSSFSGFVLVKNSTIDDLIEVLSSGMSFNEYLSRQSKWVMEDIEIQKIVKDLAESVKNDFESLVEVIEQISNTFRTFHVLVSSEAEKKVVIQPNYFQKFPEIVSVQLQGILDFLGFTYTWRVINDRIILEWKEKPSKKPEINIDERIQSLKGLKGTLETFTKDKPEYEVIKELSATAKNLEIPNWTPGFFMTGNRRFSYIPQDLLIEYFEQIASQENSSELLHELGNFLKEIRIPELENIKKRENEDAVPLKDVLLTIKYLSNNILGWGKFDLLEDNKIKITNAIVNFTLLQEIINCLLQPIGYQIILKSSDEGHNNAEFMVTSSKVKILIVDDEKRILNSLAKTLEREKRIEYEIIKTESGEEALELVHRHPIELVLSDQRLGPGLKGTDILEKIRLVDPNIIRILITGYGEMEIAKDAVNRARIHYFIEKPPDPDELKKIVFEEIIKKRQNH